MLKCASFFAGVGGIDKAFGNAGFTTVFANEIDKYAATTFAVNFPDTELVVKDITQLDEKTEIPDFDIMLAGFPCQAFSIAGKRKGFDDEKGRGVLFFDLLRIIDEKQPSVLFFETVKNLVTHDNGNTYARITSELVDRSYYIIPLLLNAASFGNIPQARERIYIVCFKDEKHFKNFEQPDSIPLTKNLKDFIDFDTKYPDKYYYKDMWKDYVTLSQAVVSSDTCYQWRRSYVRENKKGLCPTLTATMGMGGNNVPLVLTKHGIRKLLPRECFNLQGYSTDYVLPETLSDASLYKQAGNSVAIPVVERIARNIMKTIKT